MRLLFDDYYQKDRGNHIFSQGVARKEADRSLSNFYFPEANGIPNGTFVLTESINDKFKVEVSQKPIDEALLESTDAYMLVCPLKPEAGGRAALGEREAQLLERFVGRGRRLVLVFNSLLEVSSSGFDFSGMNIIARRFGVEFQAEATGTLSVPIAKDHPLFDGVKGIIYGNGSTLKLLPSADPATLVLLEDPRENTPHAPIAALIPYKKGKVFIMGDSGTLGNAHMFRTDLNHLEAAKQMLYGLLPDGPVPRYGWKQGQRISVRVTHEQVISGYPYGNKLLNLPKAEGSELVQTEARALDLDASPDKRAAADRSRYASTFLRKENSFVLEVGAFDGRAYAATWRHAGGERLVGRILPKGRILDSSSPTSQFTDWQWALENELLCSPLKPYAKPGDVWQADEMVALPHAQLSPVPTLISAPATIKLEGKAEHAGKSCFVFSRTVSLNLSEARLQDFVAPQSLSALVSDGVKIYAAGQFGVTRYWIDSASMLPVHTETRISAGIWYKDAAFPDRYEGTHDWRNFENWKVVNFIATFGRLVTADFEVQ